jgi:hypothetical protein
MLGVQTGRLPRINLNSKGYPPAALDRGRVKRLRPVASFDNKKQEAGSRLHRCDQLLHAEQLDHSLQVIR